MPLLPRYWEILSQIKQNLHKAARVNTSKTVPHVRVCELIVRLGCFNSAVLGYSVPYLQIFIIEP